jgi:hypothetical protein
MIKLYVDQESSSWNALEDMPPHVGQQYIELTDEVLDLIADKVADKVVEKFKEGFKSHGEIRGGSIVSDCRGCSIK